VTTVIYGQDRVVENALVTILFRGHALLIGAARPCKTKLVDTLGITSRTLAPSESSSPPT